MNHFAEVAEEIRHGFHLGAVVADGEVSLGEDAELGVELEGAEFAVAEELRLDAEPSRACRAAAGAYGLHELRGYVFKAVRRGEAIHHRLIA